MSKDNKSRSDIASTAELRIPAEHPGESCTSRELNLRPEEMPGSISPSTGIDKEYSIKMTPRLSAMEVMANLSFREGMSSVPTQTALRVLEIVTNPHSALADNTSSTGSQDVHNAPSDDGHNKSETRSMFDILEQKHPAGLSTSSLRRVCRRMAGSVYVALFFAVITLWVLFADDLRYASFPPSADEAMGWLSIACMAAFTSEIIMYSFGSREYVGSFFFWLDLLATASMILDVPSVEDAIFEAISGDSDTLESATLTRATRTSRMGTRAGRIASAMRVVRLFRLMKLFKHVEGHGDSRTGAVRPSRLSIVSPPVQQSRVGQKLSELTTRRVVLGVLAMVFVLPYWEISNSVYGESPEFDFEGLRSLHNQALVDSSGAVFMQALEDYQSGVTFTLASRRTSELLHLQVANVTYVPEAPEALQLRSRELRVYEESTAECATMQWDLCFRSVSTFDRQWDSQMDSVLQICKTVFILIVLGVGALLFSADANRLVLIPVDRMVQRVKNIADNPRHKSKAGDLQSRTGGFGPADTEMRILEASIDKISELLAVAFGDAGVDIIAENMKCMGGLNPMVPGQRTVAIFGFCDIRNFTDITEVLQEGVMSFVNTIADIVHSEVHEHEGAANKNIGDAFLLVWKFRPGFSDKHLRALLKAFKKTSVGAKNTSPSVSSPGVWESSPGYKWPSSARGSSVIMDSTNSSMIEPGSHAHEARTLAAMSDMIPRDNALFSVTSLTDSTLAVVREAATTGDTLTRHSSTVSWSGLQAQPSSAGALAAGNLSRSAHAQMSELSTYWMGSSSSSTSLSSTSRPSQRSPVRPAVPVPGQLSLDDGSASYQLGDSSSVIIHESLTQLESPCANVAAVHASDCGSREHLGGVVLEDMPVLMARAGSGRSSGSESCRAGRPVGEGGEEEASKKLHSVSFDIAKTRAHHRHKSTNYSRLLDYRVDEWLPVEFDPLNVPEDLREEQAYVDADGVSAGPSPEPSCTGSEVPRPLSRQSSHGIMLGLPEKLRVHAEHAQHLADNALNSFVIINSALQRSAALAQYVHRKDVQTRMGSAFRVGMGFGLHAGWSIEGAIGSKYKVDASYLSPNVNMAARLESATKQYGVSILMSGDFAALLSSDIRNKCRQIDAVLVKGSSQPMPIWTIDVDTASVLPDNYGAWQEQLYVHASKTKAGRTSSLEEFESHADIVQAYCVDERFLRKWKNGYNLYKAGLWSEARTVLEGTYTMRRDADGGVVRDTPSKVLLDFMAQTQYLAPGDWMGHRELTEK